MEIDERLCYRAHRARDPRFDGRFFVGVTSTGIYCRPVCPAPSPRREHVRYYTCAAAAEDAGFRPCRRCRPETAPGTPAWTGTSAVVTRALRLIAEGTMDDGGGVDALADRLGVGARHLRRLFDRHLGASPLSVARTRRVHFARRLIDDSALPMTQVAVAAGFGSLRQFNDAVRDTFGQPPTALRRSRGEVAPGTVGFRLSARLPFDMDALLAWFGARAIPGVEVVADGCYRRTVSTARGAGFIQVERAGDASLLLRAQLPALEESLRVVERVRRLFDLDADPLAIGAELRRDAALRAIVGPRDGLRVPGAWDGFELAVRAVVGQQVSVAGARTLLGRLVAACGERAATPLAAGLTHVFPTPAALAEASLEGLGLTGARRRTLRALAKAALDGLSLEPSADPGSTLARLREIPGVGAWTAQYVALRALRDPDAFPAGDLGLRRALARPGGSPLTAAVLARRAEAWRPWRAYAAVALWRGDARTNPNRRTKR